MSLRCLLTPNMRLISARFFVGGRIVQVQVEVFTHLFNKPETSLPS